MGIATLKEYAGVLPHHIKLIAESGIRPDQLHELHRSSLFSLLLRCPSPKDVDMEAYRNILSVPIKKPKISVGSIRRRCVRKLEQATQARKENNIGGPNNWFHCMRQVGELLHAFFEQVVLQRDQVKDNIWKSLKERYYAEASAFLLLQVYNLSDFEFDKAYDLLREVIEISAPCSICYRVGFHGSGVKCGACSGTKQLAVKLVVCPQCGGTGEGDAYADTLGGLGVCSLCIDGSKEVGKIRVDEFGKTVYIDPIYILGLPQPL